MLFTDAQVTRFWSRVDQSGGPTACWPWQGARQARSGHGKLRWVLSDGEIHDLLAHRVSAYLNLGLDLLDPKQQANHRLECSNPPCVNPAHLYVGTQADNMHDAIAAGTHVICTRWGSISR